MRALLVLVTGLGVAGLLPAVAAAGRFSVAAFLAPVAGAVMAAMAAVIELAVGGSLAVNYAVVAAIVNLAVIAGWLMTGHSLRVAAGQSWGWPIATVAVLLACLAIPVATLKSQMIGPNDPNDIWLVHTLMVYGGHHDLLTGLQNAAYRFSSPDYPPLVPAAGALAFRYFGLGDLHLAVEVNVLLTACALGVAGHGIAISRREKARWPAGAAAVAAAGAVCLAGFAASGVKGIDGHADLLWAGAGTAAVIWGLVLPPSAQALRVAWICAAAASLTKNEGLTTALVVLVLIAARYRPLKVPGPKLRGWAERALFVVVPALPGVAWAGIIRLIGIHDGFFTAASRESPVMRAHAAIAAIAGHLAIVPVALAVMLAGACFLRGDRARARLGNPVWLWLSCLGSLANLLATYVVGGLEIHSWLSTSVSRTTIFAQVLLYADLAIWLVAAVDSTLSTSAGDIPTRKDYPTKFKDYCTLHRSGALDVAAAAYRAKGALIMKLVVFIPCYNEQETLPLVLETLPTHIDGISEIQTLIVDDGSTDKTVEIAKNYGITEFIRHRRNQGLSRSFRHGLMRALELGADIIVMTEGDNQYKQERIPDLIGPILDGTADMVISDRMTQNIAHFSRTKKSLQRFGTWVLNVAADTRVPDAISGFRAYSRLAAMQLSPIADYSWATETTMQASQKKLRIEILPIPTNPKLRESRQFKSSWQHVRRSSVTIIRSFVIHRPYAAFIPLGAMWLILSLVPFTVFAYSHHLQDLVIASALLITSLISFMLGVIADLARVNRILVEEVLEQVKIDRLDGSHTTGITGQPSGLAERDSLSSSHSPHF